jgi:3',5'-cyclic AMP phosphodiesterase CpdA
MRAIDLRIWFIGLTIAVFVGISYQNARWLRNDFDALARFFAQEMLDIEAASARTSSPRIIFAGGSSVIYAVDAKEIERDLGIPVINMAMLSRIGSDNNYFGYLLPHIREGDVIIYNNHGWLSNLTQEAEANETRRARRLADRLWEFAQIDLADRQRVDWPLLLPLTDVSVFNRLRAREQFDDAPSAWQRGDHGGLVQCPTKSAWLRPHDAPPAAPNRKVIAKSEEFVREVVSRGAHVIFFETPILIATAEREKWSRYRKELRSQLTQMAQVLDATESLIFSVDPDRFCDDAAHVDDNIRSELSQSLSAQLRQVTNIPPLGRTGTKVVPLQLGGVDKFTQTYANGGDAF